MRPAVLVVAFLIACAVAAPAQAVTLVDQGGRPIGGYLQQWADGAKVPTVGGDLTLITHGAGPTCPVSCSQGPGDSVIEPDGSLWTEDALVPAEVWLVSGPGTPYYLYAELGHEFDWRYLTGAERHEFAEEWQSALPWWSTETALSTGREDGLEAVFAADYADCALGREPLGTTWVQTTEPPDPQQICQMVDRIGAVAGAQLPGPPPAVSRVQVKPSSSKPRHPPHRRRHDGPAVRLRVH
jgi:hypothetical protein